MRFLVHHVQRLEQEAVIAVTEQRIRVRPLPIR
jgi:hypothetical protein